MTLRYLLAVMATALGVAGCLRGPIIPMSPGASPSQGAFSNGQPAGPVVEIPVPAAAVTQTYDLSRSVARFGVAKIVVHLPRGETLIAYPRGGVGTEGTNCNFRRQNQRPFIWDGGQESAGGSESALGIIVFESMKTKGYKMAGDPSDLFDGRRSLADADYLIGARIINLRGGFCHSHSWWDGSPLHTYSGELSLEVEWSVQDNLARDMVFTTRTTGEFRQEKSIPEGVQVAFDRAFAVAARRFAQDGRVQRLAMADATEEPVASAEDAEPRRQRGIVNGQTVGRFDIQVLGPNVVTVRAGTGHGSGFFIGKRGLVITNAHVVGDAPRVRLITASGLEIDAEVLARDKRRDVALLQSAVKVAKPLEIRLDLPEVAEEVFAIGSPIFEELRTTVTKGVVSAIRKESRSGNLFIQSDASISLGNSGGPLLDSAGRVVGISVLKFVVPGAEGLGLFIPIGVALEHLGVVLDSQQAGS